MSHPVTTCRESMLSFIHLSSPVALWCQTQWCYYRWVDHLELRIHWALTISSTSKFLSFPTATVGASNTPSANLRPWKQHIMLLVGHLLKQVWGIIQELYQMTFVLDIAQEICLRSCSRHISIYLDAFNDFLGCSSILFHWFAESCWLYPSAITLATFCRATLCDAHDWSISL